MIPIRNGPLKGNKWIVSSGSKFVKGTYEPLQTKVFLDHVKKGDTVFDVGAHVGYFTVLSSILTGGKGEVTAFEPLPLNLKYLKRHIHKNGCKNVKIIKSCIADKRGETFFDNSHGSGTGHISEGGKLKVKVESLDNLIRLKEIHAPDFIKVDVEGAEELVLKGAIQIIKECKPKLLIS